MNVKVTILAGALGVMAASLGSRVHASGPITAPITEWPIPAAALFNLSEYSPNALDPDGNFWLAGTGVFTTKFGRFGLGDIESYAFARLTPGTDTVTFWPIAPAYLVEVRKMVAAPDGSIFMYLRRNERDEIGRFDPATGVLTEWASDIRPADIAVDSSTPNHLRLWILGYGNLFKNFGVEGTLHFATVTEAARLDPATSEVDTYAWVSEEDSGAGCGDSVNGCLPPQWRGHFNAHSATRISVDRSGQVWLNAADGELTIQLDPATGTLLLTRAPWGQPDRNGALWGLQNQGPDIYLSRYVPSTGSIRSWADSFVSQFDFSGPAVGAGDVYVTRSQLNTIDQLDLSSTPLVDVTAAAATVLNPARVDAETWRTRLASATPLTLATTRATTTVTSAMNGAFAEFPVPTPSSGPAFPSATACNVFFLETVFGASSTTSVIGRLKTSAEAPARDLESSVNALVDGRFLTVEQGSALNAQVDIAIAALIDPAASDPGTARAALAQFITLVNTFVRAGTLAATDGTSLGSAATALIKGCTFVD